MLLSIFTPTHNPKHLPELFRSLTRQRNVDWEWVLCPNGPAIGQIPRQIAKDKRVRIVPYHLKQDEVPKIGALKRFGCDNAKGDAFIELDHDDMLVPGALEKIAKPLQDGAGFVYSDAAVFVDGENSISPIGYGERWGWETYELRVYGMELLATRAFDVSPRSLSEVYYAPDHVRVWSREAYYEAGGHNPELIVGDDHDLICRTYLAGARFAHTGGCTYLYRDHPGNTVKSHNKEIQRQQNENRDRYFYQLVDEWVRRNGYTYLDMNLEHPYVKFDADGGLRLKYDDESVGAIRCFDFLQHTPTSQFMQVWEEIYRVLIPGGWVCVSAPSTQGQEAFAPHYQSFWNEQSFTYTTDWECAREMGIDFPQARFQLARCWTSFPEPHKLSQAQPTLVYADLCALKGQRQPGLVKI